MCHAVKCRTCGRTSWAGCGRHVDQVMARVPAGQRCPGHPEAGRAPGEGGLLGRIFGRR
jgi:hypothetical protein